MQVQSIIERHLFSTVRIETEDNAGDHFIGTGFLFQLTRNGSELLFLVTNRHFVKGAIKGFFLLLFQNQVNPLLATVTTRS